MKLSESWLREWVNPALNTEMLCQRLTMGGLEVEGIVPIHQNGHSDNIIEVAITPNRGDCLSVRGLARDTAALTDTKLHPLKVKTVSPKQEATLPIIISESNACPHYAGRIIQNIKANVPTPDWLKERLHHAGLKSINAMVDVTNYVMLELGQPMHAFDVDRIHQKIEVRYAKMHEELTLLDGTQKKLDSDTLVIADASKPLAIAGVMGGIDSSVTLNTRSLFLESAYFQPLVVARQRQYYQLNSDSAYRFERGVDPYMQHEALERATQLICDIVGGEAGPVIDVLQQAALPIRQPIVLAHAKIKQVLGFDLPEKTIAHIFDNLDFTYKHEKDQWVVSAPTYRFDISLPEDLIEEIVRINGYEHIPVRQAKVHLQTQSVVGEEMRDDQIRQRWQDRGYHEIITYSFIDAALSQAFDPTHLPCELVNPITADMNVMRTSLWPGLIKTLRYNMNRQQDRVRLFELGICFIPDANGVIQEKPRLAGLITGLMAPLQWGIVKREVDFFDLKGDLEMFFETLHQENQFEPHVHPVLHPGQSAIILSKQGEVGVMGALHPVLCRQYDLPKNTFVFELDLAMLQCARLHPIQEISKFPEIRRDIAILVPRTIPAKAISDTIKSVAGNWLKNIFIFDLYQGKGIASDQKSIALALILQHPTRTLVDEEITTLITKVVAALKGTFGAELRS